MNGASIQAATRQPQSTALKLAGIGVLALAAYLVFHAGARSTFHQFVPVDIPMMFAGFVLLARISLGDAASAMLAPRVLVLGVGQDAAMVKRVLSSNGNRDVNVIGYCSLDGEAPHAALSADTIFVSPHSIEEIARRHDVSEIIIAMRERRGEALPLAALLNCRLAGIAVTDLPDFFERHDSKVRIDLLRESWFIFGDGFRQHLSRIFIKRAFDILASVALLILSAPLMLLAAIAIKLESRGPIIYRQQRVGHLGKPFDIYKFRSMRTDAESDGKPKWAQPGDTRVTRVGRFMRLTRIDELPQLINVLAGDMSVVGPRPERPYFVEQLTREIPFYGARHSVKPGVTGWAQVRHCYGASVGDSSDKLQYDLYYVKNHTLLFDLRVLVHSVRVVLLAEGSR